MITPLDIRHPTVLIKHVAYMHHGQSKGSQKTKKNKHSGNL